MGATRNRVLSIGLEVEGGWANQPQGFKHDGSVQGLQQQFRGEVSSEPLKDLTAGEAWLRAHYPQEVNNTCGFHVHICLPALHYSRIMDTSFNEKFLSAMEEFWSRYRGQSGFDLFRTRLDGQNQYCQKIFRPEHQLWRQEAYGNRESHPRYSQLNYCFGRHGTMECRLFPCFEDVNHSIEGMKSFVNSVNEYLATCKPAKPVQVAITADEIEASIINRPTRVSAA